MSILITSTIATVSAMFRSSSADSPVASMNVPCATDSPGPISEIVRDPFVSFPVGPEGTATRVAALASPALSTGVNRRRCRAAVTKSSPCATYWPRRKTSDALSARTANGPNL